jgi:D-alanine transaminase
MDRGFLYGDGVYEVVRTHGGRPFMLAEHLVRLASSARKIGMTCPRGSLLRRVITAGLKRAGYRETFIYVQVTRGVAYPRSHVPAPGMKPTVLAAFWRLRERPASDFARGVACVTVEDFRWGRCDVKSLNLLANTMAVSAARWRGAAEAIFVRNGRLVEGGLSAVFVARRGRLRLPRLGQHILPSLTRKLVVRTARRMRIPVDQGEVTVRQMMGADEVFLASTTAEGVPVVRIDGRRIGDGRPGPLAAAIRARILREAHAGGGRA